MDSKGVKPWWLSKTIWSAIAILALAIAPTLGLSLGDSDVSEFGGALDHILTGVLAVLAIVARVRASQKIGSDSAGSG